MIKQTEITLDIIPIYINEMYPKKEGIYHYGCIIDSIEKNKVQALKERMIQEIRYQLSGYDCVIILEKGKVISVLK